MRRRTSIILTFGAILLLLGALFVKQTVNFVVGRLVIAVFEKETGCSASLSNPRVVLHSLRASADNIRLHCDEEPETNGLFIDRITTIADLSMVRSKRILLHDLKLYGTRAVSYGLKQTGFVNLVDFIARDPRPEKEHHWHSWLSAGWKARVDRVEIYPPAEGQNLELRFGAHKLGWNRLMMIFQHVGEAGVNHFAAEAESEGVTYELQDNKSVAFGAFKSTGVFGDDKLSNFLASILSPNTAKPIISSQGTVHFAGPGRYDVALSGESELRSLASVIMPENHELESFDVAVDASGNIEGELLKPALKLQLVLQPTGPIQMKSIKFPLDRLNAEFHLSEELRETKVVGFIAGQRALELQLGLDRETDELSSTGNFALRDLDLGGIPISSLSGSVETRGRSIVVKGGEVVTSAGKLSAEGSLTNNLGLEARLVTKKLQLENLPQLGELIRILRPNLDGQLNISGSLYEPIYNGDFRLTPQQAILGEALSQVSLAFNGAVDRQEVAGRASDDRLKFKLVRLKNSDDPTIELSAEFTKFPLGEYLTGAYPNLRVGGGELSGALNYRGAERNLIGGNGELKIEKFVIPINEHRLSVSNDLRFMLAKGAIDFGSFPLNIDNKTFTIAGSLSGKNGWGVTANGGWDLGSLVSESSLLEQVSGDLLLDLELKGPISSPRLSGTANIMKGSISLPFGPTIIGASDLELNSQIVDDRVEIKTLSAEVEGGSISGSGEINSAFDPSLRNGSLRLNVNSVAFEPVKNFTTVVQGEISVEQKPEKVGIAGALELVGGSYEDNISLERILRELTKRITGGNFEQAQRGSALRGGNPIDFDLKIRTVDPVVVDTNVVKAEVRGELALAGDSRRPKLIGTISTTDGSFYVGASEFVLVTGAINFDEKQQSLDPTLSIVGESEVSDSIESYRVRMLIDGTLTKPNVVFDSEGGLSQREIVAKLGAGTSVNRITLIKNEKRDEYRFDALLRPDSKASLEERISGLTGFTSVEVGSAYSPFTGEYVPKLFAVRPLAYALNAVIETELGGARSSSAGVVLPVTPYTSLSFGWTNGQTTTHAETSSGALDLGLHYRESFRGTNIIPPFWQSSGDR